MTNEELADLIVARSNNLREHFDRKLTEADARDPERLMMLEEHVREHFDLKLSATQTHIYGLLSMESDMLDLRGAVARPREMVNAQGRALEERR